MEIKGLRHGKNVNPIFLKHPYTEIRRILHFPLKITYFMPRIILYDLHYILFCLLETKDILIM